jgi:ribosomal protein S18 acetylase RimI-like enzyme
MVKEKIIISDCDFTNEADCQALITLMNHYMADKMGGSLPFYTNNKALAMVEGLRKHPSKIILLAKLGDDYAGLVNCFVNFGTFAAKPFINIHDIVVIDKFRGKGIGRRLMEAAIRRANELDCCKITLEVRTDNMPAKKLYSDLGFAECDPAMHFWTKYFD